MSHLKRDKKKVVIPPSDDCSCTSTETDTSSDCTPVCPPVKPPHNKPHYPPVKPVHPPKYEKYDENCNIDKKEGKTCCRRKCRTICVVECEKEVCYKYDWCYKTKQDDQWCEIKPENCPKKCDDKAY